MDVKLGRLHYKFPSEELQQLTPCNELLSNSTLLNRHLQEKGYLFLRDIIDKNTVLKAKSRVLQYISEHSNERLSKEQLINDGVINHNCGLGCIPFMEGIEEITHHPELLAVLENQKVREVFETIFGRDVITFNYKWLRCMHHTGFTGAHVDSVYMGRGTPNLLTTWIPFMNITPDMGTLAICESSNVLESFSRLQSTYGNMDVEKINLKGTGWFTESPLEITERFGGVWKTTEFNPGDLLIFTTRTVHMSTTNLTNKARISCDVRWQSANEDIDSRYMNRRGHGDLKFGVYADDGKTADSINSTTIDQLKQEWGFQ